MRQLLGQASHPHTDLHDPSFRQQRICMSGSRRFPIISDRQLRGVPRGFPLKRITFAPFSMVSMLLKKSGMKAQHKGNCKLGG
jgi:hypothetical protein